MKSNFSKSLRRITGKSLPVLIGLMLGPLMVEATDPIYINTGTINGIPPNVDATNFYNSGTWDIVTDPLPYTTANTQNYTNEGSMTGSVGWEFDFGPSSGPRGMSASFFNDSTATILANGALVFNPPNSLHPSVVSYLWISATNIVNKGTLEADSNGQLILNGSEVNLSRSLFEITPIVGNGSPSTPTNFTPDVAIYDEYWLGGTNMLTVFGAALVGTTVGTFTFTGVNVACGSSNATEVIGPLTSTLVDSYSTNIFPSILMTTNSSGQPNPSVTVYSNSVRQAIFTYVRDPNIFASNHFGVQLSATNYFLPMAAKFSAVSTNVVTGALLTNTLYVVDDLAAVGTNGQLAVNLSFNPGAACTAPTYRPNSVIVSRIDPSIPGDANIFASGSPGMGIPPANFFYVPFTSGNGFSNSVAYGRVDLYSALVANLAAEPPPGFSVTNAPGEIEVSAHDLNLNLTRMSAASWIDIQASNLVSSAGAAMDCQNLSYNLGSTNGMLNFTNLATSYVQRLHGTVTEFSGLWTNFLVKTYVNYVTNSAAGGWMESDITNVTEVDMALTVVDATNLTTTIPVTVLDLALHSTNMLVSDSMIVANSLLFDGRSLTLQGQYFYLSGNVQYWNSVVAPSLLYFTNDGTLYVPEDAHFGDDTATNYAEFVNNGSIIVGGGETINSVYYQDVGTEIAAGGYSVTASTGLVENASITSGQYLNFAGGTFQLGNSLISAGNALNFSVTNSLFDNGSFNGLGCTNGFNLLLSPQSGNLLGSTITDVAPKNYEIGHAWAGGDSGPTATGLSSNVAIGTLKLVAQNPSQLPLFHFYGTTGSNAMYVNTLDLSLLTTVAANLGSMIRIDPGMKIYFSHVLLGFAPTSGQAAANYLQAQFPGQFIQDPNVGQGVSSPVKISGAAFYPSGPSFVLTWTATAGATYSVYKTNVINGSANWPLIKANYPAGGAAGGPLSYTDTTATISPAYYRVSRP
jgi:hypothetical protein